MSIMPNCYQSKQTLLDEATSTVVCASPLLSEESSGGSSSIPGDSTLGEEGVVIFVTHQSALVVWVDKRLHALHCVAYHILLVFL